MDDTLNDTLNDTLSEPVNKFGLKDEPVNGPVNGPVNQNGPINDTLNDTLNETVKLTSRHQKIIEAMSKKPSITAEELMDTFGVSLSTLRREFAHLQKEGYIHREGSRKTGIWVVNKVNNK